ncbi:RimJ/RimL family protein N-acetyltransferase [Rhodoglobus vestalii]|uniref:RimJ/RimL family protein N-acetyltransferase n=1 Tax=Rhodoglobus vestalii TaxID=193384 RepID=A0A8H2K5P0_9MICO|nr:GNAT family N-acetyltransferase [Rhodoglobus vestalii]TQO19379.1 RimJ/RimL family protein N-acetyltransferase [Rhodoglobus vestalii]
MQPFTLTSERLTLDMLTDDDSELMTAHCQDPIFEHTLTIPWPYAKSDAEFFITTLVPEWWEDDDEYTWAIRETGKPELLLGVISFRVYNDTIGYWMGAPFRGKGFMKEAVAEVTRWVFSTGRAEVRWEALVGNEASAAIAKSLGFVYTGVEPSSSEYRGGTHPPSWWATLTAPGENPSDTTEFAALPWPSSTRPMR